MDTIKKTPPVLVYALGRINITDETYVCNLYFQNVDSYEITQNPFSNASIVNNKIMVKGDNRDTAYNITVYGINRYGRTSTTMTVSEGAIFPVILKRFEPTELLKDNTATYDLLEYFRYAKRFSIVKNPYSSANLVEGMLSITGNYRDLSYIVVVEATNSAGSIVLNISVSEDIVPPVTREFTDVIDGLGINVYLLSNYIDNAINYVVTSNPFSNVKIMGRNMISVLSASRNTEYNVAITASNVNHLKQVRASVWNMAVRENKKKPKVIQEFTKIVLAEEEVMYDLNDYFTGTDLSFEFTNPKFNARITNGKLYVVGDYRNTEYVIEVRASNTNFMNVVQTATSSLVVVEKILPPFLKMSIDGRIYMTNETKDFNLLLYFGGDSVVYECATHSINYGILRIQADYRNTEYDVVVIARNASFITSKLTIPISEDIRPCKIIKTWGDDLTTIYGDTLKFNLLQYFSGQDVKFEVYSLYPEDNVIASIDGTLGNTGHNVVIKTLGDRVIKSIRANYKDQGYNVIIQPIKKKSDVSVGDMTIKLADVVYTTPGYEVHVKSLKEIMLSIKGDYRNSGYDVVVRASNMNYMGKKYIVESLIKISETIRVPTAIGFNKIELYQESRMYNLSDYFRGDVGLRYFSTFPGIIVDNNTLVISPAYRNAEYSVQVKAVGEDYLGNMYDVASSLVVVETNRSPVLTGGVGLAVLGELKMTNNVIHISLSRYFEYATMYSVSVGILDGGNSSHGVSLFHDILTIAAAFRNSIYEIRVTGSNVDFTKLRRSSVTSSFTVYETIQRPRLLVTNPIHVFVSNNRVEYNVSNLVTGPDLEYSVDSEKAGMSLVDHILVIQGDYRDTTYNVVISVRNEDIKQGTNILTIPFVITESQKPPYVYPFLGPEIHLVDSSGKNIGLAGNMFDATLVNNQYRIERALSLGSLCIVLVGGAGIVVNIGSGKITIDNQKVLIDGQRIALQYSNVRAYDFDLVNKVFSYYSDAAAAFQTNISSLLPTIPLSPITFGSEFTEILVFNKAVHNVESIIRYFNSGSGTAVKASYTTDLHRDNTITLDISRYFTPNYDELVVFNRYENVRSNGSELVITYAENYMELLIKATNKEGEASLSLIINIPPVEIISEERTFDVFLTDNASRYIFETHFKYALSYRFVISDPDTNVYMTATELVVTGNYRNKGYTIYLEGKNRNSTQSILVTVYETILPPIVINGGLESHGVVNVHGIPLMFKLSKYFSRVDTYLSNMYADIQGNKELFIKGRNRRNEKYSISIQGISKDYRNRPYPIESVLTVYEIPSFLYLRIHDRALHVYNNIVNLHHTGFLLELSFESRNDMFNDINGPYVCIVDRRTNLYVYVNSEDRALRLGRYNNYDKSFAWVITCDDATSAFSVYNPAHGYICDDFTVGYHAAPSQVYMIKSTSPEVRIPVAYINDTDVHYNLNMLFRHATSYTCTSVNAVIRNDNTLSVSRDEVFSVTARNYSGQSTTMQIVSSRNIVVAYYFTKSENGIATFNDHSGNVRNFAQSALFVYTDEKEINCNAGPQPKETGLFVEDYSTGWTIELRFLINTTSDTTIVSTPVGNVHIVNQQICLSRNNILHFKANGVTVVSGKWFHVSIMQNGKMYVDGVLTTTVITQSISISSVNGKVVVGNFNGSISFLKIVKANVLSLDVLKEIPSANYNITQSSPKDVRNVGLIYSTFEHYDASKYGTYNITSETAKTTTTLQGGTFKGEWIQIELPNYVYLKKCVMVIHSSFYGSFPKTWDIVGSLDGNIWHTVKHDSFDIANDGSYFKYFRIIITQTNGNSWAGFKDIKLYETRIIFPTKVSELGMTNVLTDNSVNYNLRAYFKNVLYYKHVSDDEGADVRLEVDSLTIQGTYMNNTYSVLVTGYNDFGGKTLALTARETLRHPVVVNGGLESFENSKALHSSDRLVINIRPYFNHAFTYELSATQAGVEIDDDDFLIITRMYRNTEFNVGVYGVSTDHMGERFRILSLLTLSDSVHPPTIIKDLQDEGVIRLTDNTVTLDLKNYFSHVLNYFESDKGVVVENRYLELTGNFRNTKYDVKVTANSIDYLRVNFVATSHLSVSETIKYPEVVEDFKRIRFMNTDIVDTSDAETIVLGEHVAYDLTRFITNASVFSIQSFSFTTPIRLEMFIDNLYYPKKFAWKNTVNKYIREGSVKNTELIEKYEGSTESFSVNYYAGWTLDIKFKLTNVMTGSSRTILRTPIGNLELTNDCKDLTLGPVRYTGLQQNIWYTVIIQQNGLYSVNGVQYLASSNPARVATVQGKYYIGNVDPLMSVSCLFEHVRIFNDLRFYKTVYLEISLNGVLTTKEFSWTGVALFQNDPITKRYYTNIRGASGTVTIENVSYSAGWTIDIMFNIVSSVSGPIVLFNTPFGKLYLDEQCTKLYFTDNNTILKRFQTDGLKLNTWYMVVLQRNGAFSINGMEYTDNVVPPAMHFSSNNYILGTSPCLVSHVIVYNVLKRQPDLDIYFIDSVEGQVNGSTKSLSVNNLTISASFATDTPYSGYQIVLKTLFGQLRIRAALSFSLQSLTEYRINLVKDKGLYSYTFANLKGYARVHNICSVYGHVNSNINTLSWIYDPDCLSETLSIEENSIRVIFKTFNISDDLLINTQCGTLRITQSVTDINKVVWVPGRLYIVYLYQSTEDYPIRNLGSEYCSCVISYQESIGSVQIPIKQMRVQIVNNIEWNDINTDIYIYIYNSVRTGYTIDANLQNATFDFWQANVRTGMVIDISTSFGAIRILKKSGNPIRLNAGNNKLVLRQSNIFSTVYGYYFVGSQHEGFARVHNNIVTQFNTVITINDSLNTALKEKHPHVPKQIDYVDGWTLDLIFKLTADADNNRVLVNTPVGQLRFLNDFTTFTFSELRTVKYSRMGMEKDRWYQVILRQNGSYSMEALVDISPKLASLPYKEGDGVISQYRIYNRQDFFKHVDLEVMIDFCVDTTDTVECSIDSFFVDQRDGWGLEFELTTSSGGNAILIRAPFGVVRITGGVSLDGNSLYGVVLEQRNDAVVGSHTCKYTVSRIATDSDEVFAIEGVATLRNNTMIVVPFEVELYIGDYVYKKYVTWSDTPSFGRADENHYHVVDDKVEGSTEFTNSFSNDWSIDILFQKTTSSNSTLAQTQFGNIVLTDFDLSFLINDIQVFTYSGIKTGVWYRLIIQRNGVYSVNGFESLFDEIQIGTIQTGKVGGVTIGCLGNASECRVAHFHIHDKLLGTVEVSESKGAQLDKNELKIISDTRNEVYTVTVMGRNTDHEGITYEVMSYMTIIETTKDVTLKEINGYVGDAIVLKNIAHIFYLDDYFEDATDYEFTYPETVGTFRVALEDKKLTITPNFGNRTDSISIRGFNVDISNVKKGTSAAFQIYEEKEPPKINTFKALNVLSVPLLTENIITVSLLEYFLKADTYDFTVLDSFTLEVIKSHGVSVNGHVLAILPAYRNIAYNIVITPKISFVFNVDGIIRTRFISDHPLHVEDTYESIIHKSTLYRVREGPPLPVPKEPRVSLTHMITNASIDFYLDTYFTGIFFNDSFNLVTTNGVVVANKLSVPNIYSNSINVFDVHAKNDSGSSKTGYLLCVQQGAVKPQVIPKKFEYIFLTDNSVDILLSTYFTGIATFYTHGSKSTTNPILSLSGSYKNAEYAYTVFAGNESGVSDEPFEFRISEGKNISNCFICTVFKATGVDDDAYFETAPDVFSRNTRDVAYSSNFRSIGASTTQIITDYGGETNYSAKWMGYFTPKETGIHTFYMGSDDASILTVWNETISIPGIHDAIEKSIQIHMDRNTRYNISVYYGNKSIDSVCYLEFKSPNMKRTSEFRDYIYWTADKYFGFFDINSTGMRYSVLSGVKYVSFNTTGTKCIFTIVPLPSSNYFAIQEVVTGKYLKCTDSSTATRFFTIEDIADPSDNKFHWYLVLHNAESSLYLLYSLFRTKYLNSSSSGWTDDKTSAGSFVIRRVDDPNFIINDGLERISPLRLTSSEFPFTLDLSKYIGNIQMGSISFNYPGTLQVTNTSIKLELKGTTNQYSVVTNMGTSAPTILQVSQMLQPVILKDCQVAISSVAVDIDLPAYVSNSSIYTIKCSEYGSHNISANKLTINPINAPTTTTRYIILIQCSSPLSTYMALLQVHVTQT
jgi:hypothetical protein